MTTSTSSGRHRAVSCTSRSCVAAERMLDEPDPLTIRRAAAGDRDAFAEIVRATQANVWRYLVHLVGDHDRAADLTQDTFVKAHRALAQFRFRSRFTTWLLAIARRVAIDDGRRQRRR